MSAAEIPDDVDGYCVDDWPTTEATFRRLFPSGRRADRHPRHPRGRNFLTSDLLGYVRTVDGPCEVSTGWFLGHRLFGLTWPKPTPDTTHPRDTAAHTWADVVALLSDETTP